MDRVVAYHLLTAELNRCRQLGYDKLATQVGDPTSLERRGSDGLDYSIVLWVHWHDAPDSDIVVDATVGPVGWGCPHDRLDDSCIVSRSQAESE